MIESKDTEPLRRLGASCLQWGGWVICIFVFAFGEFEYSPDDGHFAPQWVGFTFIFAMGVGIAGTLVRSRMRLTQAMVAAFTEGRKASRNDTDMRVDAVVKRQQEIMTKLDAFIMATEVRADVAQRQQEILDRLDQMEQHT